MRRLRRPPLPRLTWPSAGFPAPLTTRGSGSAVLRCSSLVGGESGRRAAENGLTSIVLTSSVVNMLLKPLGNRRRPDRDTYNVPTARHVRMPRSTSWPSGHAASAFAFATGAAAALPAAGIPLNALAALVAYSRIHTGVHYPGDTIAGAVSGAALAPLAIGILERRRKRS